MTKLLLLSITGSRRSTFWYSFLLLVAMFSNLFYIFYSYEVLMRKSIKKLIVACTKYLFLFFSILDDKIIRADELDYESEMRSA